MINQTNILKILIVEDNPADREIIMRLLTQGFKSEYEFLQCQTGRQGLNVLKEETPDCILLDYLLPDMNGLEFLSHMNAEGYSEAVIMLTGQGDESIAVEAMKRGAKDYVVKSKFTSEYLHNAVVNAIHAKHKQTRQALLESESRLQSLFDNAMDGMVIINERGIIESFTRSAEKIFGYSKDEIIGKNVKILMPEHHRNRHDGYIEKYLKTGKKRLLGAVREFEGVRKGGEVFPLEISLSEFSFGETRSFMGAIRDISERKKSEELLEDLHKQMEMILNSAGEGIFGLDYEGKTTFINPVAAKMFGYEPEELIGKTMHDITHHSKTDGSPYSKEECPIYTTFHSGKVTRTTSEVFWKKDGSSFPVEYISNPIIDGDIIIGTVVTFKDITEQKQMQAQLNHSQKMESIGQLAAGMAHEINTPMQFIGDNTRFLEESFHQLFGAIDAHEQLRKECKKGAVSENVMQQVESSLESSDMDYLSEEIPLAIKQSLEGVERVTKIIKAMKEFSHPGSEEKVPMDINQAIETTLTVARNEWKYFAEIEKDFDPGLPPIPCFANDFNQVILNVVVNAAHAIAEKVKNSGDKGTIAISTKKDGDWAEIRIQDNGPGIPESIQSKIFDPFFTTKEVGKGTGQGLSIVHSIVVKKHGGTVNLGTDEGKGTTFIFRFPISAEKK